MIYGIDIGSYTEQVDWKLLKSKGIEFAMIKATQGDYLVDKNFPSKLKGALDAGIIAGLYHWCDPLRSGTKQADYFLSRTASYNFDFAAVDVEQEWADWTEWPNRVSKIIPGEKISTEAQATAKRIKENLGKKTLIYTRASFVHEYASDMVTWLSDWPLWIAHWAFNAGRVMTNWETLFSKSPPYSQRPDLPRGSREYIFHQWSGDRFVLPGMFDCTVDLNSYDGTVNDLRTWLGMAPQHTKEDLLQRLEHETEAFMLNAAGLHQAVQDYIQAVRGK